MRCSLSLGLPLVLALCACSARSTDISTQNVDINAAADAARNDIATYAAEGTSNAGAEAATSTLDESSTTNSGTPKQLIPGDPVTALAPSSAGGLQNRSASVLDAPSAADTENGAATLVRTYYALIEAGKYRSAWALWADFGNASGMSAEAFAVSFDKYRTYHAVIGAPGPIDAGAGQRYVTVPVALNATSKTGKTVHMRGAVTLRRTANIDGATAAQKSWHISAADFKRSS